jgi:cytoskeletal protein CcmA (bactofilin family)
MFRKFKNKSLSSDDIADFDQAPRGALLETQHKPTIISEGCRIDGTLQSSDVMYVEGEVIGSLESVSLTIGQKGRVNGEIKCTSLSILGCFEGRAECDELNLGSHAVVSATLRYKRLKVAVGATIQGEMILR